MEQLSVEALFIKAQVLLVAPGSPLSVSSLACAFLLAAGVLVWRRVRRGRELKLPVMIRALFPKTKWLSASHRADIGFVLFNAFLMGVLFGWALLTYNWVSAVVIDGLVGTFGASQPTALADIWVRLILTLGLFVAFEFAYWLDHFLSHRVPILWEFHRVHHEAETLTPFTVFRVHPVDSIVYYNISAICMGLTNGVLAFAFGTNQHQFTITDTNVIIVCAFHLFIHLQHSHMWITFPGVLGRIFMSPAGHQIHHSMNPAHFNRNMGGALSIFDWLFGTLYVPSKSPEKLTFGVAQEHADVAPHTFAHTMVAPLMRGGQHIAKAVGELRGAAGGEVPASADGAST